MQNEFEKKVQQQMEGFRLTPADAVWDKVATGINREKKRRGRLMFWWTAAIIIIGAGAGVWLNSEGLFNKGKDGTMANVTQEKKKTTPVIGTAPANIESTATPAPTNSTSGQGTKTQSAVQNGSATDATEVNTQQATSVSKKENEVNAAKNLSPKANLTAQKKPFTPQQRSLETPRRQTAVAVNGLGNIPSINSTEVATGNPGQVQQQLKQQPALPDINPQKATDENQAATGKNAQHNELIAPSAATARQESQETKPLSDSLSSIVNQPLANQNDTAIQTLLAGKLVSLISPARTFFGLSITTGVSDNRTGFPVLSEKALSDFSSTMPNNQTGGSARADNPLNSGFNTKFSFGVGAFAGRKLTKRLAITTGLNYHYFASGSAAGSRVNSPRSLYDTVLNTPIYLNQYYSVAASNAFSPFTGFTNTYQLLQVPLQLEYQLKKNARRPIIAQAGLTPAVVLGTRALYYNSSANITYVNRQQFRQYQLFANGGFQVQIARRNSMQYSIGPQLQYGITNLTRQVVQTRQHLFYAGVQANLRFNK